MTKRIHPKIMLVEGREELRVIPELIEACGVQWGETPDKAIVFIKEFDGISNLIKHGVIEAELKATGVEQIGIVVDGPVNLFVSSQHECQLLVSSGTRPS